MKILRPLYITLFSLAALMGPALSNPAIPDTPAGQAFSAWFTSFNSADAAHLAAFKEKFQRKGGIEEVLRWREATGGFDLLRIEESRPDLLRVLLKERDSDRAGHFKLSRTGDTLIMEIRGASLPPEFAPQRLTQTDALAALTARADWLTQQDRFSGAFLVAQRGARPVPA